MSFNIDDECCSQAYNAGYMLGSADKEAIIIKLLEEQVEKWDLITKGEPKSVSHYWLGLVSTSFIDLIKGEK